VAVAGGVLPLALAILVRASQINGVESVVVPDCCGDKPEPKLLGRLIRH
jgi:hypothetical protein